MSLIFMAVMGEEGRGGGGIYDLTMSSSKGKKPAKTDLLALIALPHWSLDHRSSTKEHHEEETTETTIRVDKTAVHGPTA